MLLTYSSVQLRWSLEDVTEAELTGYRYVFSAAYDYIIAELFRPGVNYEVLIS